MEVPMAAESKARLDRDRYFMGIAMAVRARANCRGNHVGAILVLDGHVVSTGYNGTPSDMVNCEEGGCDRCANREKYGSGKGYDLCICVHAEQNALLSAARFGIPVQGAVLYTTMRPCFGCTKELLQAKVKSVFYMHDWKHPDPDVWHEYEKLQQRFPGGIRKLEMDDPDKDWAVGTKPKPPEDSGHSIPGN
jgi:dCMP deaminase